MDRFRTVKISDPRFESNNLRFITIKTPNLKGRGNICLFVPPGHKLENLPIVILLHGVYGSALSWSHGAGAHLTVQRLIDEGKIKPMILAMPSDGLWGDGSAYLPHNDYNFEKWIVEDVIDAVRLNIPEAKNATINFIAGLSMGGFGALRLGAKFPDKFQAFSGLSAITSLSQMKLFVEEPMSEYRQSDKTDEDVLLTILANKGKFSSFRFDCGRDDLLIEYNRHLHQQLLAADIPHIYEEYEGQHEWSYWEEHLSDTLLFFNRQF